MVENSMVRPLTIHQASFWDYQQLWDSYVAAIDGEKW
jgi:hypothetical protein